MISDTKNKTEEAGSENQLDGNITGADEKFRTSVKNLLLLIKDFYAADYTVVYWFNKSKHSFKLLSDSEESASEIHKEKFVVDDSFGEAGKDILMEVCERQQPKIMDDAAGNLIHIFDKRVKSVAAYPLVIDNESIGVLACESKAESFFGQPNLDTLKIFADSVSSYIKYFSLSEEFDFEDGLLKVLASGKFNDKPLLTMVQLVLERFIDVEDYYVVLCRKGKVVRARLLKKDGVGLISGDIDIEEGTLIHKAITEGKIFNRYFRFGDNTMCRYSKLEDVLVNVNFCAIPFRIEGKCFGLLAFDTREDVNAIQNSLKKIYKYLYPVFLYLDSEHGFELTGTEKEYRGRLKGKSEFDRRLKSELARCRQFDEYNLFVIAAGIDNIEALLDSGYASAEIEQLIIDDLEVELVGYDQVYKASNNRYFVLLCSDSEERVHIEFEKIRKNISVKIHYTEGKEVTFTASFAIKRYLDAQKTQDEFLKEMEEMLRLSGNEGGNQVKI